MSSDLHLKLNPPGRIKAYFGAEPQIVVAAPKNLAKTKPGSLLEPPQAVWSAEAGYSSGDLDLVQLGKWLRESLGVEILNAIATLYPIRAEVGDRLRVFLTAENDVLQQMMNTPWEVLESFGSASGLSYGERLSVLRVLSVLKPEEKMPEPVSAGERIKIAILWANPFNDIDGLKEHREQIQKIIEDRQLELNLIDMVEFESVASVRTKLADKSPHVVYYIGHAVQNQDEQVAFAVGKAGSESYCSIAEFRRLLEEIGPPQLLLLNACSTTVGHTLNPYLGAALRCAQLVSAVITMQTDMPVAAAHGFASGFFRALAAGQGVAESLKWGRREIFEVQKSVQLPPFSPYIPVLLQQTQQDQLFTIDIKGRELRYLLLKLRQDIPPIFPYLKRKHDEELGELFETADSAPHIKLITGPHRSGKSTSVGRAITGLLSEDRYRSGYRHLYYSAQQQNLEVDTIDGQIKELFKAFADRFSFLVGDLKRELGKTKPEETLVRIASWLEEEERKENRYCVCLDNLPSEVASKIAMRASSLLTKGGSLILVTDKAEVPPDLPIKVLEVSLMTTSEIEDELKEQGALKDKQDINRLIEATGCFPFFVAGYLRRQTDPPQISSADEQARYFIESREPKLSDPELEALRFAATCSMPIPAQVFESPASTFAKETVQQLVDDCLLMKFADGAYQVPGDIQKYLQDDVDDDGKVYFHELAAREFLTQANDKESSHDELTFQLVTRWLREGFQHLVAIVRLDSSYDPDHAIEKLKQAQSIAEILHYRYLDIANETGAAKSLWEEYREAALELEQYEDRDSDLRYADSMVRAGMYEPAEELLDKLSEDDDFDLVQVDALVLHSDLLKDRGMSGGFAKRIDLLKRALTGAEELLKREPDSKLLKTTLAHVEHSLGNALGYGKEAQPEEANRHLQVAERIFAELNNPLRYRAASEAIEIKRYNSNNQLTEPEREEAIRTLLENRSKLITRASRFDAIMHSYELGRLAADPRDRAAYFLDALERAGQSYEPIKWHAAINWRRAQIDASIVTFQEVAADLEEYCEKLASWQMQSWSRRKRRNTLLFLAQNYVKLNLFQEGLIAIEKSWSVAEEIARIGEGRKDPAKRLEVGLLYATLALQQGQLEKARAVAAAFAQPSSANSIDIASMDRTALETFFDDLKRR